MYIKSPRSRRAVLYIYIILLLFSRFFPFFLSRPLFAFSLTYPRIRVYYSSTSRPRHPVHIHTRVQCVYNIYVRVCTIIATQYTRAQVTMAARFDLPSLDTSAAIFTLRARASHPRTGKTHAIFSKALCILLSQVQRVPPDKRGILHSDKYKSIAVRTTLNAGTLRFCLHRTPCKYPLRATIPRKIVVSYTFAHRRDK